MAQVRKATPERIATSEPTVRAKNTSAPGLAKRSAQKRPQVAVRHELPMSRGERARIIAAAMKFLADQRGSGFDDASDEQDVREAEMEIMRRLDKI